LAYCGRAVSLDTGVEAGLAACGGFASAGELCELTGRELALGGSGTVVIALSGCGGDSTSGTDAAGADQAASDVSSAADTAKTTYPVITANIKRMKVGSDWNLVLLYHRLLAR